MDLYLLIGIGVVFLLVMIMRYDPDAKLIGFIEQHEGVYISKSEGADDLNFISHISSPRQNNDTNHDQFYIVVYYDKHDDLREAIVKRAADSGELSFYKDKIIKTAGQVLKEEKEKEHLLKKVDYKTKEGVFSIMQEYDRPNIRERILLNGEAPAGGKYRLGFMAYAIVKRGRIARMASF